jgi:flagellar biosynthetic protein FliR
MDPTLLQEWSTSMFLHMVRAATFMAVAPIFGRQRDSFFLRLVLAVALGAVFWWVGDQRVAMPQNILALAVICVREGVVGFALGFAVSLLTMMLVSAGEIVSSEMGFAMARTMNPESGASATVVSQLFQVFAFLLILHFNLHHEVLRILADTFRSIPVGSTFDIAPICHGLLGLVSAMLVMALQYAFPVLSVMLLVTVGLVLLGRAVPAINLMEFSFAARILLALLASAWFLAEGSPFLIRSFGSLLEGAAALFQA